MIIVDPGTTCSMTIVDPDALGLDTVLVPEVVSAELGWTDVQAAIRTAEIVVTPAGSQRGRAIIL
jgi:hypothetical protein